MMGKKFNNELETSIVDSVAFEHLSDMVVDWGEINLDALLENDLIGEIPLIKTIIAIGKSVLSIKDRIFIKKVLRFLYPISEIAKEERINFSKKVSTNDKFRYKVGETLILILDRLDDLDKPAIVGKLFVAYIQEKIDYDSFVRLSAGIDRALMQDLRNFFNYNNEDISTYVDEKILAERMFGTGFSNIMVKGMAEGVFNGTAPQPIMSSSFSETPITHIDSYYKFTAEAHLLLQIISS